MGQQNPLQPSDLGYGRLRIDLDKEIHKLDIDKAPLMKLMSMIGKEKSTQMKYEWLTKARRSDWINITAVGGAWAAAGATTGTITISAANDAWLVSAGDILHIAAIGTNPGPATRVYINIYVDSIVQATGVITGRTWDNTTLIDLSGFTAGDKLLCLSNSFELGSNRGTVKSHQPDANYNYIQIIQHPFGVVETLQHVGYDAGGSEWDEMAKETAIEHEFAKEKTFFFGRRHLAGTGYMIGDYAQYFTGGILEAIEAGAPASSVVTQLDLTREEFGDWINSAIYYAKKPVVFASGIIFEALSYWLNDAVQTRQDEKTLGIAVSSYMNQYGQTIKIIPHRELLKNDYSGYAFCVDLADLKYKFLQGEDTHMEVGIQLPGEKKEINELRTWFGAWLGDPRRHGVLKGVATIS